MHDALAPSTLRLILGTSNAQTTELSIRSATKSLHFDSLREVYSHGETISDVGSATMELAIA